MGGGYQETEGGPPNLERLHGFCSTKVRQYSIDLFGYKLQVIQFGWCEETKLRKPEESLVVSGDVTIQ